MGIAETIPQPLTATGAAFNLTIQNSGKTPALDIRISGTIGLQQVSSSNIGPEVASAAVLRSLGPLLPNGIYKHRLEFRIPLRLVVALYRNQTLAIVHVSITYKDIFKAGTSYSN